MRRMVLAFFWLFCAHAAPAGTSPAEDRLLAALGFEDLIAIMRDEGLAQSADLADGFLPDGAGADWQAILERIYTPARMAGTFRNTFADQLSDGEIGSAAAFFDSTLGHRVVVLEVSARRAYAHPEIEAYSKRIAAGLVHASTPRARLLRRFIEVNDLINANVTSALNASVAFYDGLEAGGAFPDGLDHDAMLRDVWSRRDAVRSETETWLFSYLALAYRPLSDADFKRYIAFSRSAAGRAVNDALFKAFDAMFSDISRQMGEGLGLFRSGSEL